jgi:hypothetical protein
MLILLIRIISGFQRLLIILIGSRVELRSFDLFAGNFTKRFLCRQVRPDIAQIHLY